MPRPLSVYSTSFQQVNEVEYWFSPQTGERYGHNSSQGTPTPVLWIAVIYINLNIIKIILYMYFFKCGSIPPPPPPPPPPPFVVGDGSNYGGPVGRGCHDVHICDLRTCTHAHLGFADLHIRDLRTCTYAICGSAIVSTWLPRGNHVVNTL